MVVVICLSLLLMKFFSGIFYAVIIWYFKLYFVNGEDGILQLSQNMKCIYIGIRVDRFTKYNKMVSQVWSLKWKLLIGWF